MTTASARPAAGSRAAEVHQRVHGLRAAAANEPPGVSLSMIRRLSEDEAKSALAVAIVSERWSPEERRAMAYPPQPDFDAIRAENQALIDEYHRRVATAQDHDVTFDEGNAA